MNLLLGEATDLVSSWIWRPEDILKYLFSFGLATAASWFLTWIGIPLLARAGLMDLPDERRIHNKPTPRGGGVAVFFAFHLTCASIFLWLWPSISGSLDFQWWIAFIVSSTVLVGVGLWDDRWGMKPFVKLAGQLSASALLFVLSGGGLSKLFGYTLPPWLDFCVTLVWCAALINAFNLIDGLDGVCAGVAIISALGCGIAFFLRGMAGEALISLVLVGSAFGFLRYNFNPARIFLGDTGSMFLGFSLAAIALQTSSKQTLIVSMGVPLLAAGVPLMDASLAVWRRSVRKIMAAQEGKESAPAITAADRDHLHHRLLDVGLNHHQVALALYGINALFVVVGLLSVFYSTLSIGLLLGAFIILVYIIIRHVVHVELWDTGRLITRGIRRPTRGLARLIRYPMWDTLWLSVAVIVASFLCDWEGSLRFGNREWLAAIGTWIAPTFVMLAVGKTYVRIWSKATFRDYVKLLVLLLIGCGFGVGVNYLIDPVPTTKYLVLGMVYFVCSQFGIFGIRTVAQALRESMVSSVDRSQQKYEYQRRILLYGAGEMGNLYLRELRIVHPEKLVEQKILGFIDDNVCLRRRYSQGVQVLGTGDELSDIIKKLGADEVIVTTDLASDRQELLLKISKELGLRIARWTTILRPLVTNETSLT